MSKRHSTYEKISVQNSSESGFTLIELLVTISIVGILASISMYIFSSYRVRAYNASAQTDLRNLVTALKAKGEGESFADCTNDGCITSYPGFTRTEGVCVEIVAGPGSEDFSASAEHDKGNTEYLLSSALPIETTLPSPGGCLSGGGGGAAGGGAAGGGGADGGGAAGGGGADGGGADGGGAAGGGAAGCFTAGTLVAMSGELRPIEKIQKGELVLAFDIDTRRWTSSVVEDTYEREFNGNLVDIAVAGEIITATDNHPIWVVKGKNLAARPFAEDVPVSDRKTKNGRWVAAGDLQLGDSVLLMSDKKVSISALRKRHQQTKVYNIKVAKVHTYAVGERKLLVHNKARPE